MNTKFDYMYRDASNYKAWHSVVLAGVVAEADILDCLASESDGTEFIPSQVGLPDLQNQLDSYPSEDDHVWHNMESVVLTDEAVTEDIKETAEALLSKFRSMKGKWDVPAACKKHGFTLCR